jgi:MOSC domain-containing protein YiiM
MERLGHMDCGVYAEVVTGGTLEEGDSLAPAKPCRRACRSTEPTKKEGHRPSF